MRPLADAFPTAADRWHQVSRLKSPALDIALAFTIGIGSVFAISVLQRGSQSARDAEHEAKTKHQTQAGESAEQPHEIPAPGWWDIARRTYHEIDKDRVRAVAAGVTFYALLAMFPALTALVSVYGLVAEPATISEHVATIEGFLPSGSGAFLQDQIGRMHKAVKPSSALPSLSVWHLRSGAPMPA